MWKFNFYFLIFHFNYFFVSSHVHMFLSFINISLVFFCWMLFFCILKLAVFLKWIKFPLIRSLLRGSYIIFSPLSYRFHHLKGLRFFFSRSTAQIFMNKKKARLWRDENNAPESEFRSDTKSIDPFFQHSCKLHRNQSSENLKPHNADINFHHHGGKWHECCSVGQSSNLGCSLDPKLLLIFCRSVIFFLLILIHAGIETLIILMNGIRVG